MKNLFFISILVLFFSCGDETKTDDNSSKIASSVAETTQNDQSTANSPSNIPPEDTKVLAKNEMKEEAKIEKSETKTPETSTSKKPTAKEVKNSAPSTVKSEAEAKAQMEAQKAKELAEKNRIDEEMKKAEEEKIRKVKAKQEKLRKEREMAALDEKAKQKKQEIGGAFGNSSKPEKVAGLHDSFDALLKKYVSSTGKVNYSGLKKEEGKLDSYLNKLENTTLEKNWSRNKKLAFWINAYNAYTIKLILKNYPVKSIMDLHNGKPWDVKWIKLDQRTLSLNNIENDIIRPKFNEPRIHFAVNCAAKSCPPLLNKAWTSSNLNTNFERQTKAFINNSSYNTISSNSVEVSKIFDWYGKDFGDLRTYLNKYSNTKISSGISINFKSYNWDLNN